MIKKNEFSAPDIQQTVIYGKRDPDSTECFPILLNADGSINITQGFSVPEYDTIDITYSGSNITTVVYSLASVTQATLTLTYSGSNLTKVVKT